MKLNDSILKKIKKNMDCVRALEDLHERAPFTMQTWLKINHPMLCHIDSLKVICVYLKLDIQDLVEECTEDLKPVFQT